VSGIQAASATALFYWWHFPELLTALPWRRTIFEVIDDHAALGMNQGKDRHNARIADLVARAATAAPATSAVTASLAERLGRGTVTLPVAFDFSLARELLTSTAVATPRDLRSPAVAFAGGVDDRIDWRLLKAVAEARPQWQFHMLGGYSPRNVPGNVISHGPMPYGQILSWLPSFDVAWLPFVVNALTTTSDFLKTWDYRASGLRVVATSLPSTVRAAAIDEGIMTCSVATPSVWIQALEKAIFNGALPMGSEVMDAVSTEARLKRLLALAR
jgi:hypothetical protein